MQGRADGVIVGLGIHGAGTQVLILFMVHKNEAMWKQATIRAVGEEYRNGPRYVQD